MRHGVKLVTTVNVAGARVVVVVLLSPAYTRESPTKQLANAIHAFVKARLNKAKTL